MKKTLLIFLLFLHTVWGASQTNDTILIKVGPLLENGGYESITTGTFKGYPIVIRTLTIVDVKIDTIAVRTRQKFKKY